MLGELKCHLKKRGYNNASINHCYNKASGIDRKDLIQYKEKNANNRVPFVITYHPAFSNLSSIVREHWTTIQKHPELCKIFKETPVLAFRKPKSLKDILVRDDISPRSAYNSQCQTCDSRLIAPLVSSNSSLYNRCDQFLTPYKTYTINYYVHISNNPGLYPLVRLDICITKQLIIIYQ